MKPSPHGAAAMKASLSGAVSLFAAPLAQTARLLEALRQKAEADPSILAGGAGTPAVVEAPVSEAASDGAASDEPASDEPASDEAASDEAASDDAASSEAASDAA